tara:strand:+ start:844 stop:1317 length:474 start_codon:yes stop_codon:yes gene_type:complete
MFKLAICDLYHPLKYGNTENSSNNIMGQFLVIELMDSDEFFDEPGIINTYEDNLWYTQCYYGELTHPFIRNYNHYILSKKYNNTAIVETHELPGGELVAVFKTFWISIIQRRWKHIMQERRLVLHMRKMPSAILYRETHGKWPPYCSRWPLFMLNIP